MYVVYLQSLVPARFETRTVTGLVKGHAYSVTAVEEVKAGRRQDVDAVCDVLALFKFQQEKHGYNAVFNCQKQ